MPDLRACGRAQGVSYVKVPEDVLAIVSGLEAQGQRDRLLGAYVAYFLGAPVGNVPKSIRPFFNQACGIADRITDGIRNGGKRRGQAPDSPPDTQGLPADYPPSTRREVANSSPSTQDKTEPLAAETGADPRRGPHTPYSYSDETTNTDTETVTEAPEAGAARTQNDTPTLDDVRAVCRVKGYTLDPEYFFNHYESQGWVTGDGRPIRCWPAILGNWETNPDTLRAEGAQDAV